MIVPELRLFLYVIHIEQLNYSILLNLQSLEYSGEFHLCWGTNQLINTEIL